MKARLFAAIIPAVTFDAAIRVTASASVMGTGQFGYGHHHRH